MAQLLGMDIQRIREMAAIMDRQAQAIQAQLAKLAGQTQQMQWQGPDADQFRATWEGQQRGLTQVAAALKSTAAEARAYAEAQARASKA